MVYLHSSLDVFVCILFIANNYPITKNKPIHHVEYK